MSNLLTFVSPWEFLLRYSVITGVVIAIIGTAICMLAKSITLAKRGTDVLDKKDRLYLGLFITGMCLVLVGVIVIALPINATLYRV